MLFCGGLATAALVWPAASARGQIPTPQPSEAATRMAQPSQDDSFPALQHRLADAMAKGDLERAAAVAEHQHTLFPNEMKATADLGDVYLARGDAERAEPLLRAAITQPSTLYTNSIAPVLGEIYENLGQIALAKGQAQDAISQLQRAVDYSPTSARPRFLLAAAFAVVGETERSAREVRAAFDIDSSVARVSDYLLLARSLRLSNNLPAAAQAVDAGIERFPHDVDLRVERAAMLRARKQTAESLCELIYVQMLLHAGDPRTAALATEISGIRAEADAPSSADGPTELKSLFSYLDDAGTGQYDEALPTIQEVAATDPGFVPHLLLARAFAETGRMAEAEHVLQDLVTRDPSSVPALAELAGVLFAEGRSEAATQIVDRARAIDPENVRLREVMQSWHVVGSQ
jgi:tetratricopeptide (TPR) repeat protein